jgi:hypothetical protein
MQPLSGAETSQRPATWRSALPSQPAFDGLANQLTVNRLCERCEKKGSGPIIGGWHPWIMQFCRSHAAFEDKPNGTEENFQPRSSPNSLLAALLCSLSRSLVAQDLLSRRFLSRRAALALAHWLRLFEPMKARWFLAPRRLQVDLRTSFSPQDPIERDTAEDAFFKRSHWELPKPSHHGTGLIRLLIDETWRVTVS